MGRCRRSGWCTRPRAAMGDGRTHLPRKARRGRADFRLQPWLLCGDGVAGERGRRFFRLAAISRDCGHGRRAALPLTGIRVPCPSAALRSTPRSGRWQTSLFGCRQSGCRPLIPRPGIAPRSAAASAAPTQTLRPWCSPPPEGRGRSYRRERNLQRAAASRRRPPSPRVRRVAWRR